MRSWEDDELGEVTDARPRALHRDGDAVGRRNKAPPAPIVHVSRPALLGLGARPASDEAAAGYKELARDELGRKRHVRTLDEELVDAAPASAAPGVHCRVSGGPHDGMLAVVGSVSGSDSIVRLDLNEQDVKVALRRLVLLSEHEYNKARDAERAKRRRTEESGGGADEAADGGPSSSRQRGSSSSSSSSRGWLVDGILVRIVSKSFRDGQFYMKKGVVVDMPEPRRCTLRLVDDGRVVDQVQQRHVETTVPSAGGRVRVVAGRYRGQAGRVLEKSSSKQRAVVQLDDDMKDHRISYDDLCTEAAK